MVSLMTALWFAHLEAPDRVSVKPHASPVLHAINHLLGRLDRRYLTTLREYGGLQSYPSRTKDPDPVDYSTGSVGIGATAPIWGALAHRYVAGHFEVPRGGRQIALIGDAELDEGACWEAIADPMVAKLGEVMWVVDLNRQSLDRVVPDIAAGPARRDVRGRRLALRDGQVRAAAGPPARPLRERIDAMPNEEYQRLLRAERGRAARAAGGRRLRPRGRRAAGDVPRPRRPRPRRARRRLPPGRRRAGPADRRVRLHDQGLDAADGGPSRPTTPRCSTPSSTRSSRRRSAPIPRTRGRRSTRRRRRPRCARPSRRRLDAASAEVRRGRRRVPGRPRARAQGLGVHAAGVRALLRRPRAARRPRWPSASSRSRPTSAPRPTSAAGSTRRASGRRATASTGSPTTRTRWSAGARATTAATSSWASPRSTSSGCSGELGATWSRDGQPLLPVGTIYDPFVARALEPWSFGIYAGGQSILVGTPSGVTLGPEGGAHQSVITPSIGIEQPGCVAWEPAFGQRPRVDAAARAVAARARGRDARRTSASRRGRSTRACTRARARRCSAGGYRLRAPEAPARGDRRDGRAGARGDRGRRRARPTRRAWQAEVVCVTSADLLFRSFQARAGLGEGDPATIDRLFGARRPDRHAASTGIRTRSRSWRAPRARRSRASASRASASRATSPSSTSTTRSTPSRSSARRWTCWTREPGRRRRRRRASSGWRRRGSWPCAAAACWCSSARSGSARTRPRTTAASSTRASTTRPAR